MVSPLGKYGIGRLPRIPASIGNILKYWWFAFGNWFLTDPTKYWNILGNMGSLAPEFHPDVTSSSKSWAAWVSLELLLRTL